MWCVATAWSLAPEAMSATPGHWVTIWGTAPQLTEPGNLPPVTLAQRTLRQFLRTTNAGKQVRIRFTNAYGSGPIVIQEARVALAAGSGSAGVGEINPATDRPLRFGGAPGAVIPAGATIWSDPLDLELAAMADVAVSIYFGDISTTAVTGHPGSRTTSFIAEGNAASTPTLPTAAKTDHWYVISALETLAETTGVCDNHRRLNHRWAGLDH